MTLAMCDPPSIKPLLPPAIPGRRKCRRIGAAQKAGISFPPRHNEHFLLAQYLPHAANGRDVQIIKDQQRSFPQMRIDKKIFKFRERPSVRAIDQGHIDRPLEMVLGQCRLGRSQHKCHVGRIEQRTFAHEPQATARNVAIVHGENRVLSADTREQNGRFAATALDRPLQSRRQELRDRPEDAGRKGAATVRAAAALVLGNSIHKLLHRAIPLSFAVVASFIITPVSAQQPPTPTEQALSNKLLAEISAGIQCNASAVALQQQLAAITKERDELKANSPKKE